MKSLHSNDSEKLEAAKSKLARANEHLDEINTLLLNYAESNPARVVLKPDYITRRFEIGTEVLAPPPKRINVVLGDFLHNLRSALDTAFFSIIDGSLENKRSIQFVISEDKDSFEKAFRNKFAPYLNAETVSIIEKAEPYKDGNSLLYIVSNLNNVDKHRYQIEALGAGTVTGEQLARLIPPGIPYLLFHTITFDPTQGKMILPLTPEWSKQEKLQKFIDSNIPLYISAKVFIDVFPHNKRILFYLCRDMQLEVQNLVEALAYANS